MTIPCDDMGGCLKDNAEYRKEENFHIYMRVKK